MTMWRILSLASSLMGARLAGAGLGFAVQLALARTLAPKAVGTVMLGMSLAAFFSLIVTAGYPALGVTTAARYQSLGRGRLASAYFGTALRDTALIAAFGLALLAATLWLQPMAPYLREAAIFGAFAAMPHALMRLNNIAANSLRRFSLSFVPDFVARPALLLVTIALMIAYSGHTDSWHVLVAFTGVNLGVAAIQAVLLGRQGALAGLSATVRGKMGPILRKRAVPLVLVALVSVAYSDLVTLLAALFLPPAEVAIVGVAIKVATLAGFVTHALQQFVLRDLTAAMARGAAGEVRSLLWQTNVTSLGLMLAAVAVAVLGGDLLLQVFGESYRAGHWALVLFMVSQLMRAGGGMNMHLLSLRGEQAQTAFMCFLSIVVLVAVSAIAVPRLGLVGIAVAVAVADTFWAIALAALVRRDSGKGGDILAVWR